MLTIIRKKGQDIVIQLANGQLIEIFVDKIGENTVKLNFRNDSDIKVYRGELYDEITK